MNTITNVEKFIRILKGTDQYIPVGVRWQIAQELERLSVMTEFAEVGKEIADKHMAYQALYGVDPVTDANRLRQILQDLIERGHKPGG